MCNIQWPTKYFQIRFLTLMIDIYDNANGRLHLDTPINELHMLLYRAPRIHHQTRPSMSPTIDFTFNRLCMKLFKTGSIDVVKDCLSCFAIDLPSCICKKGRISSYYVTIPQWTVFVNSALICNIQLSSRIVKFSLFFKLLYLFALLFCYLFGE